MGIVVEKREAAKTLRLVEYCRSIGPAEVIKRIVPPALAGVCEGYDRIHLYDWSGTLPNHITLTDARDRNREEGHFRVMLLEHGGVGGVNEVEFALTLQNLEAGPIPENDLKKHYPGQKYMGLNPAINQELRHNIALFARDGLQCTHLSSMPTHYHVYVQDLRNGFRLDVEDKRLEAELREAITKFEKECDANGVKTLRERSWLAEERLGQYFRKASMRMIVDLRKYGKDGGAT